MTIGKTVTGVKGVLLFITVLTTSIITPFNESSGGEFAGMRLYLDTEVETPPVLNKHIDHSQKETWRYDTISTLCTHDRRPANIRL